MVMVNRRRSDNLSQGGIKVTCILSFTEPEELVEKAREVFRED